MTRDMLIEQNMEINLLIKMMMKINPEILKFAKVFILLDLCMIIYSLIFQSNLWFLNTQVAFFSSILITIATFLSYKTNIENRLSNIDLTKINEGVDRDKIDEIDDPYDLYTQYKEIPEDELTSEKIKEILNNEKSKVKRNSFKNTLFSASGFLSIYRVLGYGILIFGFFALNNNKIFLPIAFLIGLGIVPLGVLFSKLIEKKL
ncbi:putative membrane protein [Arcobacter venerupis]|uniref:Membrane protein n=2 Tax=Arcobacter venerupis TaxID=1054033 RepID=A0AAE7E3I7_9BACT|nr:putative membrane protein [Arcobacter venerupis]